MNNLVKELIESSEKNISQQTDMVTQAKQLLSSNDAEERRLLQNLGLDAEINFYEKQNIDLQTKIKQQEFFDRPIVTFEEVQALCLKYRLYLRKSDMYVGKIPTYLGSVLNRFIKEKGIVVGQHHSYTSFYIIAPPNMFSDYTSPAKAIRQSRNKLKANFHKMMNPDPILLYRLEDGNFCIVEHWGNDFTLVRRMKAMWHSPAMINVMAFLIFYLAIPYLWFNTIFKWVPALGGFSLDGNLTGWVEFYFFMGCFISCIAGIIYGFFLFVPGALPEGLRMYKKYVATKYNWNK